MSSFAIALVFIAGFASAAVDVSQDPKYRTELEAKVRASITSIRGAKSDEQRREFTKKLRDDLSIEKDRVRRELDGARSAKKSPDEVDHLDARDTEIVKLWYSLETVFSSVFSESFSQNSEYKRKACEQMPVDVKFNDMAGLADGASIPATTSLALDLASAVCAGDVAGKK